MRPLDGLRVVDVTEGAEVVKIERPGGELMRRSGPFAGGLALPCLTVCRGRSAVLELDLKSAADREMVRQLIAGADVFIQNWKIGTDARLGLDFAGCSGLNPRLVYVRSSGFGARGPYAEEGSMDMLSQAACGMAAVSGEVGGASERTRTPILDFVSAFSAAEAAMIGIAERDRTGRAVLVDSAQLSAGLDALGPEVAGTAEPNGGRSRHYRIGQFCQTSDGAWVAVECVTEAQERALAAAAGDDFAAALRAMSLAAACAVLAAAGVPHAPVERHFSAETVDRRPGNLQRYIDPVVGEIRYPEAPWIFSRTPVRAGIPITVVGRDNPGLAGLLRRWAQPDRSSLAAE